MFPLFPIKKNCFKIRQLINFWEWDTNSWICFQNLDVFALYILIIIWLEYKMQTRCFLKKIFTWQLQISLVVKKQHWNTPALGILQHIVSDLILTITNKSCYIICIIVLNVCIVIHQWLILWYFFIMQTSLDLHTIQCCWFAIYS